MLSKQPPYQFAFYTAPEAAQLSTVQFAALFIPAGGVAMLPAALLQSRQHCCKSASTVATPTALLNEVATAILTRMACQPLCQLRSLVAAPAWHGIRSVRCYVSPDLVRIEEQE